MVTNGPLDSLNHHAANGAVRIEVSRPENGELHVNMGTGFFIQAPVVLTEGDRRYKFLLVSNRHVLGEGDERLTLVLNRKGSDGNPDYGNTHSFTFDDFKNRLYVHPDSEVDLACVDVSEITHSEVVASALSPKLLEPLDYSRVVQGSEVLFVGFPSDFYDTTNNLSLMRRGILASRPDVDFRGKGLVVIDAMVFQGSSGSPVFVNSIGYWRLLGVLAAAMEAETPSGYPAMLGLGIVIKQRHVQELIDAAVEEIRRESRST